MLGVDGALSKEGYGVLRCGDGQRPAPRLFWESFVGIIPPNHRILSRKVPGCVGKACCNPALHRLQGRVVSTELEFCKLGHPLTGDNVVVENRNGREFKRCRTCRREAWRSWQRQKTSESKHDRLNETRESEGWTAWLDFFLQGVRDTANQAARTAGSIDRLFNADKETIERFGRGAASALLVYRYAQANPLFSIRNAAREMKLSFPTASAAVDRMIEAGILRESSGKRRGRLFLYESYLDILNRDS
jgi:hypothetical protein